MYLLLHVLPFIVVEYIAFLLATLNFRYCAKGYILATLLTDLLISANGFVCIKLVSSATNLFEAAGYVLGAGAGSLSAMLWTRHLKENES